MTVEKPTNETLSVEVEGQESKTAKCNVASSSRQLYVQVKKRKFKRQYRRNQDAINFLRRFTLAVVIIDLILSISETSLISTFFMFLTLSTTFDVKPENVVDTFCYHYQGGGNSMCEQYMEYVTGYTASPPPPSAMNHHYRSASPNSPTENHFPTVPTRTPLSPSESRKLFLTYNQSLYEFPIRFNFAQKIDKDSKLSRVYARLVYLLSESHNGILNESRSLSEFLKNEASNLDEKNVLDSELSKKSEKFLLESLISYQLKQNIEVISGNGAPVAPPLNTSNFLLLRLCAKMLERMKAAQKTKQRRLKEENRQQQALNAASIGVNPFRKNLIQPTDFVRHRWKRNAFIASVPSIDPGEERIGNRENKHDQIAVEHGFDETTDMPGATGSIKPMEGESGSSTTATDNDRVQQQQQKAKQGNKNGIGLALSKTKASSRLGGSGYRLVKSGNGSTNNNKKLTTGDTIEEEGQILADDSFYDASKASVSRQEVSNNNNSIENSKNQSAEFGKRDAPMIFTIAEGNLNEFMMNKVQTSHKSNAEGNGGGSGEGKYRQNSPKYLDELLIALEKNPRHLLSLMEVGLFNNWQHFTEAVKRLAIFYRIDHTEEARSRGDKLSEIGDSVIWLSVRQKIMENLLLNMETNIFSPDTLKKAERRKRAMEQIYHDYSSSILGELKNVKEMPVSHSFHTIYWVIKLYVLVWQLTICMVLLFGSVFEDKTALNIWGIFSILTSLLHFMVDDWINTSFQPEKTSASIWFGVFYGVYKPITILLVATLSSEIFKKDVGKKRGVFARVCEIIRGRKRPPLILADKCLDKLKGLFVTPDTVVEVEGDEASGKIGAITTVTSENNNGNIVYKGIKAVKIRARIRQMEINNGNLIVITQGGATSLGEKACKACSVCGSSSGKALACSSNNGNGNDEKVHEFHLFQPSAPLDNEAGLTTEDMYPEETDDEEDDDDELEEVVDEDDDDSDEEEGGDTIQCTHPDHERNIQSSCQPCSDPACNKEGSVPGTTKEFRPAGMTVLSDINKSVGITKNGHSGLSLIACTGNSSQGNLLLDLSPQVLGKNSQDDEFLHGPIVDGGNLHI